MYFLIKYKGYIQQIIQIQNNEQYSANIKSLLNTKFITHFDSNNLNF